MKPSALLRCYRATIEQLVLDHHATNPRVFGSVLRGTDKEGSDLDLLVDPLPRATLFDLEGLQEALVEMLGIPVDVVTPGDLPVQIRQRVLSEARPL